MNFKEVNLSLETDLMSHSHSKYIAPKFQLLKWIGNKQKHAEAITRFFPSKFNRFFEPFLGSGAVMATLSPSNAVGSDSYGPLMDIWSTFKKDPGKVVNWYAKRRHRIKGNNKKKVYREVLDSFNDKPNGADFIFLVRSCYGGVIRFRQEDGFMSTPCGEHLPISVKEFEMRAQEWYPRVKNCDFLHTEYFEAFKRARKGDLIYCDPPYSDSQSILYGAHKFDLDHLFDLVGKAKSRGVYVAMSIDGKKKIIDEVKNSGKIIKLLRPKDLFEKQVFINNGSSMLRRFQLEGQTTAGEGVLDRLLLTYTP
jgi:DNA adenine methylase